MSYPSKLSYQKKQKKTLQSKHKENTGKEIMKTRAEVIETGKTNTQ